MNKFILPFLCLFLAQINLSAFNIHEADSLEMFPEGEWVINEDDYEDNYDEDEYEFEIPNLRETTLKEAMDTCAFYAKLFSVKNTLDTTQYIDYIYPEEYQEELFNIIKAGVVKDARMGLSIKKIQQQTRLIISESTDKRVRVYSWAKFGGEGYEFIIQYKIARGKSRLATNRSHLSLLEDIFDYNIYEVSHLQAGVYLLKGKNANGTAAMGIDIISNNLHKSYVFAGEEDKPLAFKKALTLNKERLDNMKFISNGRTLEMPETMGLNLFTGKRAMYYYNGVFFDNKEVHQMRVDSSQVGYILRLTFRDDMWQPLTSIYPGEPWSLVADISNDGKKLNSSKRDTIRLRDDERGDGLKQFSFFLPNINGTMTLENLYFDEMFVNDSLNSNPTKMGLPSVTYLCGKDKAFTYEWLRYTVLNYDKTPLSEQLDLTYWAVEVDGKLKHLSKRKYKGNQIYLQMNPKWAGKTIRVIPYLDKINREVYKETDVYAGDEMD